MVTRKISGRAIFCVEHDLGIIRGPCEYIRTTGHDGIPGMLHAHHVTCPSAIPDLHFDPVSKCTAVERAATMLTSSRRALGRQ